MSEARQQQWDALLIKLRGEIAGLDEIERRRLGEQLGRIEDVQARMQRLWDGADGARHCRLCLGRCCHLGHNHMGLPNLLAYLLNDEKPPRPDFSLSCPFQGPRGCAIEASRRPFACVIFICEPIEAALDAPDLAAFYALERELRALYLDFDSRYRGAGLCGILIRGARAGLRPLLEPPDQSSETASGKDAGATEPFEVK